MPPNTSTRDRDLTLRQAMVLRGFNRPVDVVRAAEAAGTPVPQPAFSAMLGGSTSYPKARAAVAAVLGCSEDRLLEWITNSARDSAQRLRDAK